MTKELPMAITHRRNKMQTIRNIIKRISVEPMVSKSGRAVPNQYIIHTPHGEVFQSYSSIICIKDNAGKVMLDKDKWDYSATTNKYRSRFLNEPTSTTRKKISAGIYKVGDLN